jgi:hypothetical protein
MKRKDVAESGLGLGGGEKCTGPVHSGLSEK